MTLQASWRANTSAEMPDNRVAGRVPPPSPTPRSVRVLRGSTKGSKFGPVQASKKRRLLALDWDQRCHKELFPSKKGALQKSATFATHHGHWRGWWSNCKL